MGTLPRSGGGARLRAYIITYLRLFVYGPWPWPAAAAAAAVSQLVGNQLDGRQAGKLQSEHLQSPYILQGPMNVQQRHQGGIKDGRHQDTAGGRN